MDKKLIDAFGGKENITDVFNCMTRIRWVVKDDSKVNEKAIKDIQGVLGYVQSQGQHQVIVGPGAALKHAQAIASELGIESREVGEDEDNWQDVKKDMKDKHAVKKGSGFLTKLSSIFLPLIPGFIAAGLLLGIANVWGNLIVADVVPPSVWNDFIKMLGNGLYTYLTIFVGLNAFKAFGGTAILGGILAAALMLLPGVPADEPLVLFGITLVSGKGGIFGVLLISWVGATIEKWLNRKVPDALNLIVVPITVVFVTAILSVLILQPITQIFTNILASLFEVLVGLDGIIGMLAGGLMAGLFLPMVMTGLHQALTPIHLALIEEQGFTTLLPILAMAGAGQVGAGFAIYFKTKHKRIKNILRGTIPVGLLGIGEPMMYGITIPLGKPFITACLGGAVGGAFVSLFSVGAIAVGPSGLALIPLVTNADNNVFAAMFAYVGGLLVAYACGFLFTWIWGYDGRDLP